MCLCDVWCVYMIYVEVSLGPHSGSGRHGLIFQHQIYCLNSVMR